MDTGCVAEEELNDSGIPEITGETLCVSVVSVAGSRRKKKATTTDRDDCAKNTEETADCRQTQTVSQTDKKKRRQTEEMTDGDDCRRNP